jgi:N-acylglucosamine-6-phosphate 2-epimerase
MQDCLSKLKQALVVSCQASDGEPLCAPSHLLALSLSALSGGAHGLRLEGSDNIAYIRPHVNVPIVGLTKSHLVAPDQRLRTPYITSTFAEAKLIAESGADIVAFDATQRERPDKITVKEMIRRIHTELNKPVWADVSTLEEGMAACHAGADIISTTLAGYTQETYLPPDKSGPALSLLEKLCQNVNCPVALEGRVWHPEELTRAFELGAHSVVVGSAITRPQLVTQRFVRAIPKLEKDS